MARQHTQQRETADRLGRLTPREREIVVRVARGRSNADIARELFVSEATVKSHLTGELTSLGCSSRVEVAVLAGRAGWLREPSAVAS